jgi:SCY1-like protein 1
MGPARVEQPTSGHAPFGNADLRSTPSSNPPQSSPFVVNQLNGLGAPSSSKGMQLGGHKALASAAIADDIAASEGLDGNPWGTDDLMDVNADQDDWSESLKIATEFLSVTSAFAGAFESAPAVVVAPKRASPIGLGFTSLATENGKSPPPAQGMKEPSEAKTPNVLIAGCSAAIVAGKSRQEPLSPSALGTDAWDLAVTPPGSWIDSPAASNTSRPSPVQSPGHAEQEPKPSTAGISKEEKAAEMARRKEERKQVCRSPSDSKSETKFVGSALHSSKSRRRVPATNLRGSKTLLRYLQSYIPNT